MPALANVVQPTRVITAVPLDTDPLILVWDLRNSNTPEKVTLFSLQDLKASDDLSSYKAMKEVSSLSLGASKTTTCYSHVGRTIGPYVGIHRLARLTVNSQWSQIGLSKQSGIPITPVF